MQASLNLTLSNSLSVIGQYIPPQPCRGAHQTAWSNAQGPVNNHRSAEVLSLALMTFTSCAEHWGAGKHTLSKRRRTAWSNP